MLSFNLENPASGTINVAEQLVNGYKMYTLNYPCSSTTSCTPYTTTLPSGKYKFEVIGAGGGYSDSSSYPGGYGGLSIGYYELKSPTTAFFYIGGKGSNGADYLRQNVNPPGGYNGGGNGGFDAERPYEGRGGSGGGSSDIRISSNSISKRIIVAGGGGGGCLGRSFAGNGGGSSGTPGDVYSSSQSKEGGAATQSNGGSAYFSRGATAGQLLYGGKGSTNVKAWGGGGGGGGLYGGGGGSSTADHGSGTCGSGGGGSGYIGGVESSSQYGITASTSTHTNAGNGMIKITIFETKLRNIDCFCSKDRNVYFCPLTSIHVLILFIIPWS